jgi:hypothetical protein
MRSLVAAAMPAPARHFVCTLPAVSSIEEPAPGPCAGSQPAPPTAHPKEDAMHKRFVTQLRASMLLTALALSLVAAGCYVAPAGVVVEGEYEVGGPPPAVQEEVVVAAPGPDFVWIGGFWDWDVGVRHWEWRPGRWERPPHAEARWVAPHYEMRGGRHYFRRGRWEHRR